VANYNLSPISILALTSWEIPFDKENAIEKDLDKRTDDALIAPPGTKN